MAKRKATSANVKTGKQPNAGKLELLALLVLIIAFFAIALSTVENLYKAIALIGILVASGAVVARLAKADNYYGLVIIRTTHGFNLMKYIAEKHPRVSIALSDLGLTLGFGAFYSFYLFCGQWKKLAVHLAILAVLFASFSSNAAQLPSFLMPLIGFAGGLAGIGIATLAMHAFSIATVPGTSAGVNFAVPGVTIPWEAIFSIAIIAIIHEMSHGVMFYIEKLKVKHSGALLFGFLPVGAFVEPDEAKFTKHNLNGKRRILVAGSASNFYTALLVTPILLLLMAVLSALTLNSGVLISGVATDSPADGVLAKNAVVTAVNGLPVNDLNAFVAEMKKFQPGDVVQLTLLDGSVKQLTLDASGKIGVNVSPYIEPNNPLLYGLANFTWVVIFWTYLLSLALAVINLLPLFITDGHKLIAYELESVFGARKANLITNAAGILMLLLLLVNLFPVFR